MKIVIGKNACLVQPALKDNWEDLKFNTGTVVHINDQGQIHNEDGPAIISPGKFEQWYINGLPHRNGAPAKCGPKGHESWYQHGVLHRANGPALTWPKGDRHWYFHGERLISNDVVTPGKHTIEQQEFIIRNRPDLIGRIQHLHKSLEAKYRHEVGLGKVDI